MREEPVISRAVLRAALVILIAGALGVGAYALVGGDIDVDLPELPEIDLETTTDGETTELEGTTLEDTTIGQDEPEPETSDPFTSAGLATAIEQVKGEVGPEQELTRLFINPVQTQLIVRRGDGIEAYSVRADTGELVREEATIDISGNATIDDFAFPLSAAQPGAVDRMLAAARDRSGGGEFEPTVLSLERGIAFGRRALEWTINARGGGRSHTYRADVDGALSDEGGGSAPIPPEAIDAQRLNECIADAANDPERIFACLERFR
jgi:hypothetical protein